MQESVIDFIWLDFASLEFTRAQKHRSTIAQCNLLVIVKLDMHALEKVVSILFFKSLFFTAP